MRESLHELCKNFINNRDIVKSAFGWESNYFYPVCAAIFTDKRQTADAERMKYCKNILKKQTGLFSNFRGNRKLVMISMLAVDSNPERRMEQSLRVYDALKEYFFSSQYLPVASMAIANLVEESRYGEIAARTKKIYDLLNPFLAGEDIEFAALLAVSDLTEEQVVQETENCYDLLKGEFFTGKAVQYVSHVLALGDGMPEEKCRKTMEMYRKLKKKGYKYGTGYELATLGILALLPEETGLIMRDVMEVDDYLSKEKGYGIFGVVKNLRLMHAGMIVTSDYMEPENNLVMNSAAIGGTSSLIAAQQTAMCAAIAASNSATASSYLSK